MEDRSLLIELNLAKENSLGWCKVLSKIAKASLLVNEESKLTGERIIKKSSFNRIAMDNNQVDDEARWWLGSLIRRLSQSPTPPTTLNKCTFNRLF